MRAAYFLKLSWIIRIFLMLGDGWGIGVRCTAFKLGGTKPLVSKLAVRHLGCEWFFSPHDRGPYLSAGRQFS